MPLKAPLRTLHKSHGARNNTITHQKRQNTREPLPMHKRRPALCLSAWLKAEDMLGDKNVKFIA